jgi:hypothetical protein
MPDQEDTRTAADRENTTDSVILLLLLQETFAGPWAVEEVKRELDRDPSDSLSRLYGAGLIHQHAGFVWATRAAVKADELEK